RSVLPAASVVTLVSAVVPPTVPSNVVTPAVFTARLKAPFTVEPKVTFPAPVEGRIVPAGGTAASLYVWLPVVVPFPPLRSVLPAASVVTLVSAVVPPTVPSNVVTPAVFTVRLNAPFTVEPKVTFPAPVEVRIVPAVSTTASLYVWLPVVVTFPPFRSVRPAAPVGTLVS